MHFVNSAALAAVLFTTLTVNNLRLCAAAKARIVLYLFLNIEQN